MTVETEQQRAAKIKFALALRSYTQSDIASECNVEPTTVGAVIHGRSRSKKIEMRIASITGFPLAELWPQWHGPKAQRRTRMSQDDVMHALRTMVG